MIKICFVILHYNAEAETEQCIASIQKLERQNEIAIVIVDNASPNGTGYKLAEKYIDSKAIKVLLREHNDGFSVGNNEGCKFAVEKWNPEFLIVANNDVQFPQKDFVLRIEREYEKSNFDVAGPDIFNPVTGMHQSPMSAEPPKLKDVTKTIILNQCVIALYSFVYPLMKKYFQKMNSFDRSLYSQEYQENVCLMGACLIFSKKYINVRSKLFEPETKFYYEEYIQTLWCMRNKKKIVYQPDLVVHHMEGKAIESVDSTEKERIRFRMQKILEAARIYRRFLWKK